MIGGRVVIVINIDIFPVDHLDERIRPSNNPAGAAVALAAVAFVALIVGMDEFSAEDEVVDVATTSANSHAGHGHDGADAQADQPTPSELDDSAFRVVEGDLKVADLAVGTGAEPTRGAVLSVHYSGWLQSSKKMFDSSVTRNEPIKFPFETGGVISGWHKGIAPKCRARDTDRGGENARCEERNPRHGEGVDTIVDQRLCQETAATKDHASKGDKGPRR